MYFIDNNSIHSNSMCSLIANVRYAHKMINRASSEIKNCKIYIGHCKVHTSRCNAQGCSECHRKVKNVVFNKKFIVLLNKVKGSIHEQNYRLKNKRMRELYVNVIEEMSEHELWQYRVRLFQVFSIHFTRLCMIS